MFFFIIKQIRVLGKYCKKWQGTQSTDKMHRTFIHYAPKELSRLMQGCDVITV